MNAHSEVNAARTPPAPCAKQPPAAPRNSGLQCTLPCKGKVPAPPGSPSRVKQRLADRRRARGLPTTLAPASPLLPRAAAGSAAMAPPLASPLKTKLAERRAKRSSGASARATSGSGAVGMAAAGLPTTTPHVATGDGGGGGSSPLMFKALWAGQFLSVVATDVSQFALRIWTYKRTSSVAQYVTHVPHQHDSPPACATRAWIRAAARLDAERPCAGPLQQGARATCHATHCCHRRHHYHRQGTPPSPSSPSCRPC